jgi:exocyst complex component 1
LTEQIYLISSLYDLANVVPTLAKYYHQASEAYEQACSRHINLVIYIVSCSVAPCFPFGILSYILVHVKELVHVCFLQHFEKLFQFARKIEELMYNMSPEEVNDITQFRALPMFLCHAML